MADSAERKAENEARFRAANERQRSAAASIVTGEELVPFLCECPDLTCTSVVQLTLGEYEAIRAVPTDSLAANGHEDLTIEHVVDTTEHFTRTRKTGAAGEAFAELDPRS